MKRPFFKFARVLTACGLVGISISAARAQSEGPFGTLVPIPQGATPPWAGQGGGVATFGTSPSPLGGAHPAFAGSANGMFSPAANGMFGHLVGPLDNALQFSTAPLGTLSAELQYGGLNAPYGTPGVYGPYNGNSSATGFYSAGWGPGYANYGAGYLNNDGGYYGYSPYYGGNAGYGVNHAAVTSGSSGNQAAPAYEGGGYYSQGISRKGYSP
jgi:hypothetical protein